MTFYFVQARKRVFFFAPIEFVVPFLVSLDPWSFALPTIECMPVSVSRRYFFNFFALMTYDSFSFALGSVCSLYVHGSLWMQVPFVESRLQCFFFACKCLYCWRDVSQ